MNERVALRVFVEGNPVAKGRPRAFRTPRGVRMHTPAKTATWENWIRLAVIDARDQAEESGDRLMQGQIEGPLSLSLTFWLLRPKSVSERKRPSPHKKPDLDNLVKAVKDGLNLAGVWGDDAQVCELRAVKRYAVDVPGVQIEIGLLDAS